MSITPEKTQARFTGFKLPEDYEKRDPPTSGNSNEPTIVKLGILIYDITRVQEENNQIELDIAIRRSWVDDRVEFTQDLEPGVFHQVDLVDIDRFWMPELYVSGMKDLNHKFGSMDLRFLMLNKAKKLFAIMRARLVMKCSFYFELYPLDVQHCTMDIMCPHYKSSELMLSWWIKGYKFPVAFLNNSQEKILPRHRCRVITCLKPFNRTMVLGALATLRFRILLQRELKAYILDTYLPTFLFVMMSWGSFLVKPDVVPGRMVLLVTNLLSLVTLFEATRNSAPPSMSVKAVEVWLVSCIVFVFLALLEYAIVLYGLLGNTDRMTDLKLFTAKPSPTPVSDKEKTSQTFQKKLKTQLSAIQRNISRSVCFVRCRRLVKKPGTSKWGHLDRTSLGLFPLLFTLYNIVYWSMYFSKRNQALQALTEC